MTTVKYSIDICIEMNVPPDHEELIELLVEEVANSRFDVKKIVVEKEGVVVLSIRVKQGVVTFRQRGTTPDGKKFILEEEELLPLDIEADNSFSTILENYKGTVQ